MRLPPLAISRTGPRPGARADRSAFTLVELLVVIGIVGILASLLLPALSRAQSKAQGVACLNQLRQLALANLLYADDFHGRLPYNYGAADTKKTIQSGGFLNWANNVMSWELDEDNTNRVWLAQGGLGPYVSGNADVFRCPADRALSTLQRATGWTRRTRSYSMNAMVGDAGEYSEEGYNENNPHYTQFFKESEVPMPARIFVLIEEHPDSINDGYFLNILYRREWFDLPASWHNSAANLTFADGHAETHRWVSSTTTPPGRQDTALLPLAVKGDAAADFDWLMERTTTRR